ncbi:hypothetical protein BD309DRAFT_989460 [Dichomitus squalens]|uniref:Uncharacterized protein n=2 Tax=Dichomitus squalens TaxID=114155 RepID=A0A4Q9PU91_9APHY|nr:uncharacterized protein DICSQDRAFT_180960 [Dichomitus squalens LYAD-421 SS1]EJF60975.1 hypothetical protein DICSQDRAFT_180960 [Dichomitus squalens LYAD-421 SS1]TBU25536.1 hypothetical protein BD311DRAFT_780302 [Dichomitus squalens]TBU45561.1 hypothetical protein BD309DRAFT_989460 [Dichomitus squalens]TBU58097.1 hypothetical protein BD310DRAFT_820170 [Dichomitus squalens]
MWPTAGPTRRPPKPAPRDPTRRLSFATLQGRTRPYSSERPRRAAPTPQLRIRVSSTTTPIIPPPMWPSNSLAYAVFPTIPLVVDTTHVFPPHCTARPPQRPHSRTSNARGTT